MTDVEYAKKLLEIIPRAMHAMRVEMRILAKPDFTVPQFRVIAKLSRAPATNIELAEWMGVAAPTMSRMVDALVKRKLIVRTRPALDRREVTLTLTDRGRAQFTKTRNAVENIFANRISALSSAKKVSLG